MNEADSDAPDTIALKLIQHMVLLVQIPGDPPGETYLVDVGFGLGLVRPIRLRENEEVDGLASPERHRLVRASHPESSLEPSDPFALEWRLQTNLTRKWEPLSAGSWRTLYQFTLQQLCELTPRPLFPACVEPI